MEIENKPGDAKYKYERLNLNIDVYNNIPHGDSILRQPRFINNASKDAALIFFDWIQVQGLIWVIAVAYPWPKDWLDASSWTTILNLDWNLFAKYHNGDYLNPLIHTILVLASPWIALLAFFFLKQLHLFENDQNQKIREASDVPMSSSKLDKVAIATVQFLYLPVAIAFFRALTCASDASEVRLTPLSALTQCESGDHIMMIVIAIFVGASFLLGLPFYLFKRASDIIVYHDSFNHERSLANREIEYLMGLNDIYERNRLSLISSYTRTFAYYRAQYCFFQFAIALFMVILGPSVSSSISMRRLNAGLVLIMICIPFLFRLCVQKTFRLARSNRLQMISDVSLVVTTTVALLSAGNPMSDLVSSDRIIPILAIVNILALVALLIWPLLTHFTKTDPQWVVSDDDVFDICVGNSELLSALNDSKILFDEALFTPSEFFPRYKVKELVSLFKRYHADFQSKIDRVRRTPHAQAALVRFSRKELAIDPERARQLNSRRRDLGVMLEWSVEDILEDLSHLYSIMRHTFSAFDDPMGTEGARFQLMNKYLKGFGHSVRKKNYDRLLMRPEKHALLRKLLFMRQFLGAEFAATRCEGRKFQHIVNRPRQSNVQYHQNEELAANYEQKYPDDSSYQLQDEQDYDYAQNGEYYDENRPSLIGSEQNEAALELATLPTRSSQNQTRASGTVFVSSYTRPSIQGNGYQPYDNTTASPSSGADYPLSSGGSGEMQVHVVPSAPRGSSLVTSVGENPFYVGTSGARSSVENSGSSALRTSVVTAFSPRGSYAQVQNRQLVRNSNELFDSEDDEDADPEDQSLL